ncbi:MAG: pantetheine-phosphate adenylyltransferase [Flavobacteriales bacterium]|jgi:pantetheine-phosphate adenylyltransferase|nr:pantetheine-phosphate adenylyltransferase [Flavobacteriales bacterium]MBK6551393.1 pantetheine-phosphate adenylyltransferase [Flavobacteriales bacterium]MBK6882792.1 pantetheine-phosphate adenylyltransferase [Flavobacteriales bacterium]MBK7101785.1 pantetheine-phosphate adenylyltransferase [Flavobacteriales bacterium]MBK7114134.1 pantetheine-phosphate adenylyltransferase [Flavobacteriales bacterium]
MSRPIAVFPGTFDPITIGHVSIVLRSLPLFERIVIGMGVNNTKKTMFAQEERMAWIAEAFKDHPQVEAMAFEGLTVELCKRVGAGFIIRGLRNSTDHGYERSIALTNRQLAGVETIFLPAAPEHAHISSTIVRELLANKADVSALVPMVLPRRS